MEYLTAIISIGLLQMLAVISLGPSFLITARMAVAKSRMDGVKVALGLGAGTVIWSSTALLGLNVLFHAFPPLFLAMKIAGALFLLWIAYQIFRHAAAPVELGAGQGSPRFGPFMQGFLTQISNPKVVVFFGSIFVPCCQPQRRDGFLQRSMVVLAGGAVLWLRPGAGFLLTRQSLD